MCRSEIEGNFQSRIDSGHEGFVQFALQFPEARFADGSDLFTNDNSVNRLAANAGRNRYVAWINPLLVLGVCDWANADNGAVFVESVSADNYDPSSASLFGTLDGIENCNEHITAKNWCHR
jgi:hypothetical protein